MSRKVWFPPASSRAANREVRNTGRHPGRSNNPSHDQSSQGHQAALITLKKCWAWAVRKPESAQVLPMRKAGRAPAPRRRTRRRIPQAPTIT